jgi:hypothetical protein
VELFGDFRTQAGFALLGFGMIFVWAFVPKADITSWYVFRGPLEATQGEVVSCSDTGYAEGGSKHSRGIPIYANDYIFVGPDGVQRAGVSYARGNCLASGRSAVVEWPAAHPETSRLRNMHANIMPAVVIFIAIFPLVGLMSLLRGLRAGRKDIRLLAVGKLAQGKLVDKKPTKVKINKRTVYEMTFSFADDHGVERRATTMTPEPELLEAADKENLIYDPNDPSQMATLDDLPGLIRTGFSGEISLRNPWKIPQLLVLPTLAVLGYGYFASTRSSYHPGGLASVRPSAAFSGSVDSLSRESSARAVTEKEVTNKTLMQAGDLARLATATASSENAATGQQANKAVDGVVDGYPGDYTKEWATIDGKAGSWLKLTWTSPQTVNMIELYDRPNLNEQITGGNIQFSDRSSVMVGALKNDGSATTLTFPPKTITSLTLNITAVSPSSVNIGLAEIGVYKTTGIRDDKVESPTIAPAVAPAVQGTVPLLR